MACQNSEFWQAIFVSIYEPVRAPGEGIALPGGREKGLAYLGAGGYGSRGTDNGELAVGIDCG